MHSNSSNQILSPSRKTPTFNSNNTLQFNSSLSQQPLTGSLNSLSSSSLLKFGPSSDANNLSSNKLYTTSPYSYSNKPNPNDYYQYPLKNDKETDALIGPKKKLTATTFIHQPANNPSINYGQHRTRRASPSTTSYPILEDPLSNSSFFLKQTPSSKVQTNRFYSTGSNPSSSAVKKSTSLKNPARPAIIQPPNQSNNIVNLNVINPTYTNSSSIKPVIHKRTPKTFFSPSRFEASSLDQAEPIANEIQLRARSKSKTTDLNSSSSPQNNLLTSSSSIKKTLENIELKMRIVSSPSIRIADLFKCFLKNVPKSTETIESVEMIACSKCPNKAFGF
ncbi:hypothetical protein BpHYR1_054544 [Brachionus plicatilis]|uniref:Uncharacterized protein n=1 Tax=Brachionus plicatilis TaxID=10195 RepID=A0A3M7SFF3_BRAPC|nr:hypothetical protein BpHYR1_054544 [Brachionus plicatilis]